MRTALQWTVNVQGNKWLECVTPPVAPGIPWCPYKARYKCQFNTRRINTSGSSSIALAINTISPSSVLR